MKKNITTLRKKAKKMWTLGTLLLLSIVANAQEVYVYVSTYPSSRGTITVGSESGLSEYEADLSEGTTITIVAVSNSGSEFVRWEDNGVTIQSGAGSETLVYEVPNDGDDHELTAFFQALLPKYDVSAEVIPSNAGTVTAGTGRITSGNGTTLIVEDNDNYSGYYHYEGWSLSADPSEPMVTTTHNYYFVVNDNTHAYAHYTYIAHNVSLTVESNNTTLGSVKINYGGEDRGTSYDVTELQDVTLVATANTNVSFSGWYLVDGEKEIFKSNQPSYTIQFPEFSNNNYTYRAKFVSNIDPSLSCSVFAINQGGNPTGSNPAITYNSQVTINANPTPNYSFIGWYEDLNVDGQYTDDELVSTEESYSFYITRNIQLGAKYRHNDWTVTITNDNTMGTISTATSFTVEHNSPVTIDATANTGYRFDSWTGSVASSDAHFYLAHVTDNLNLTTNYVKTYQFSATANNGGTVSVTPGNGTHDIHTSITATATPESDDYMFSHWTVTGAADNTDNPFVVSDLGQDYEIVANFIPTHSLTLSASASQAAAVFTITNNTTGWSGTYNPALTYKFAENDNITVTVESYNTTAWNFICWKNAGSADCFTENVTGTSYTFVLDGDKSLQASFANITVTYPVTVSVNPVDAGSVTISGVTLDNGHATVTDGLTATLTANNETGYRFDYWMINGTRYDENNLSYTFTAATNIEARFREASQINVTVVVHPAGAGTVLPFEGVQTFTDGDNISLTATPADNYNFWGWIINSEPVGAMGQNEITIQSLSEDVTIHAWFYTPEIDGTMDFLTFSSDNTTVTGVRPEYKTRITAINVPPTHNNVAVTAIANNAFAGCTSLESLYIPASVTTVGSYAFSNCVALTNIDIPSTVVSIGDNAFYGCTSLQQVELPEQLTAVEENLFYNCSSLNSVNIPANVTSIGNGAFYGCSSLYAIEIPASVTTVGMQAFMGANSLRSVTINGGVQSFGEDSFSGCTSIAQVAYNGAFEHWFDIEFENAYANPAARTRDLFVNGTQVTKLIIPDGVNTVNKYAFYLNSHIDTIVIPATVTMIDSAAFYRLTNLKRIVIEGNPAEVTAHADAFSNVNKDQVVVEVPCNYVENTTQWNGFTRIVGTGIPVLTLVQRPGGTATILSAPTCGDQDYIYSLTAQASGVYTFISWSDGVLSPSRVDTLTADKTLSPIFDRNGAAEAIIDKNIYFESGTADQEWFRISNGDNEWVVGNAVAEPNTGSRSLYVSKDGGVHCNYNPGTSPYAYTEVKLHQGIYRFNFNYLVGDDPDDNLTVALMPIPDNEDDEAYANLDPYAEQLPMLIDGLTGDGITWKNDFRLFNIPTEKWYRLVFFWNVNSDNVDDEAVAAAVDNISLSWMTPKPDELSRLTVKVMVSSNDIDKGYAYTWTDDETQMIVDGEPMSVTPEYVHGRRQKTFTYADEIWIHAVPETGYRFVNWSDGVTDANRQLDFMTIYGSETPLYVAYFEAIPDAWDVAVLLESGAEDENQNPASSQYGVMNPVEVEFQGNPTTVYVITNNASFPLDLTNPTNYPTATVVLNEPLAGWAFVGWANENGDTVSTDNPYTFSYNEFNRDVTLTALMNKLTPCSYVDNDFFNRNMPFGQFNFRGHDLDDVTVSNIEVSVRNGQILVSEAAGIEVSLYDVNGRLLESKVENSQNIYFEVPTSGTYMLKVGDLLTRRVVVVR